MSVFGTIACATLMPMAASMFNNLGASETPRAMGSFRPGQRYGADFRYENMKEWTAKTAQLELRVYLCISSGELVATA